ncbi:hypothetical protein BwSH20_61510 [Bradyrhizobium ottawaense]|nr:hypothetical protein BwSF12_04630 [Bradyrhizobium ottawaense]GMO45864.1 hypothetical protein BwSH14_61800 [Bradyrhizobium ottawaense]GMO79251.1 hypothetical protein BwSG20_56290 [Bradyrhizobium ottawaense]GMP10032.1 hypothetical protein BwSH20_61510 [Bradyrhizobium ottawaense]
MQGTLVRGIGDETAVGIVRSANLRQWEVGIMYFAHPFWWIHAV